MLLKKILNSSNRPWGRKYSRDVFILIFLIQGIIVISLESVLFSIIYRLLNVENQLLSNKHATSEQKFAVKALKSMMVYLILFMFSQIFQFIMAIESVVYKNSLQIIALLVFNLMNFVYSIFQYFQIRNSIILSPLEFDSLSGDVLLFVGLVAGVILLCQLLLMFFAFKLYQDFGWSIYRVIGSDLEMKGMLIRFYCFLMMLKFDVFFLLGFLIQFLVLVLEASTEYYITVAAAPVLISILWLGGQGAKAENRVFLILNLGGFFLGAVYFCYKIYRVWTQDKYLGFRYFIFLFASLSLLFMVLSFVFGYICLRQCGQGLDRYVASQSIRKGASPNVVQVDLNGE